MKYAQEMKLEKHLTDVLKIVVRDQMKKKIALFFTKKL
jgi:hypothetical protein